MLGLCWVIRRYRSESSCWWRRRRGRHSRNRRLASIILRYISGSSDHYTGPRCTTTVFVFLFDPRVVKPAPVVVLEVEKIQVVLQV